MKKKIIIAVIALIIAAALIAVFISAGKKNTEDVGTVKPAAATEKVEETPEPEEPEMELDTEPSVQKTETPQPEVSPADSANHGEANVGTAQAAGGESQGNEPAEDGGRENETELDLG